MTTEIKYGKAAIRIDRELSIPERAGRLTSVDRQRLVRARRRVVETCRRSAEVLDAVGSRMPFSERANAESLRRAAQESEAINKTLGELEVLMERLRQARSLIDADAHDQLRLLNGLVKAHAAFDPELKSLFAELGAYFTSARRRSLTLVQPEAAEADVA